MCLVSGVQQSGSVIHIHIYIYILFCLDSFKMLTGIQEFDCAMICDGFLSVPPPSRLWIFMDFWVFIKFEKKLFLYI